MTADDIKVISACFIFGGGLLYRSIKLHRKARKVQDTPTSKAASAPQGLVELEGFAWPIKDRHPTPSGMDAVYYSFRLEKKVTTGTGKKRKRKWICVYSSVKGEAFYLADPTGLALINVFDAELNLAPARVRHWRQISTSERKVICDSILTKAVADFPPSDFLFGLFSSPFRVVEHEIYVGAPVLAQGDFSTSAAGVQKVTSEGLSQFASRVFDSQKRALKNLQNLLDTKKDGKVDHEESKRGYAMLARVSVNKARIEKQVEKEFDLCGMLNSSQSHRLLLSDAHQGHLLDRMQRHLWLQFGGGAALVAFGLTAVLNPKLRLDQVAKAKTEKSAVSKSSTPSSVPARAVASTTSSPAAMPAAVDPRELHNRCVAGEFEPCMHLLREKNQFHLTSQATDYYMYQTCRLGQKHCK
jgi:hypothetical protein